ncbi:MULTISPECIES: putative leader peptide [Actinomadura]
MTPHHSLRDALTARLYVDLRRQAGALCRPAT